MASPIGEIQDEEYRAFLRSGEVRMQRCSACGYLRPPTSWLCPECLGEDWRWELATGRGTVETFVWYLKSVDERFPNVPYNVALVRLDEGVRVMGNVNGVTFGELRVGQKVIADIGPGLQGRITLNFRPD